jgi:hypothetical protein
MLVSPSRVSLGLTPLDLTVLTTEVATSVEETLFYIRLGFLF